MSHIPEPTYASPEAAKLAAVAQRYAVAITPTMADLLSPDDPDDPIARQFLPDPAELTETPGERADPIGDHEHSPVKGLVHRYRDRVLLKPVHACPVYCRFCFRREMVGPDGLGNLSERELDAAFAYIAAHPDIWEVILTGGDPFILSPRRVSDLMARLAPIAHVKIVRWHTRVPVVDPARITEAFVAALRSARQSVWVAIHANHPKEFTPASEQAISKLADAGIPLVSQSVLLRGVNDDAKVLEALMRRFVELRIKPYYLHQGDLAPGTGHLRTPIQQGQHIMRELAANASGLTIPRYVLDVPGGATKASLMPSEAVSDPQSPTRWQVQCHDGRQVSYQEE